MAKYTANNPRQPRTIVSGGKTYVLAVPFGWIDKTEGVSEGPFYADPKDLTALWVPELGYQLGQIASDPTMHRLELADNERIEISPDGKTASVIK